jgi:hypothetical protein
MRWTFDDGTVLHLGGLVDGRSPLASRVRTAVDEGAFCTPAPRPCSDVPVIWTNAYLVDVWAREVAHLLGVEVRSDYVRDERDAPPIVRRLLRRVASPGSVE